jgi:hypothetical protein
MMAASYTIGLSCLQSISCREHSMPDPLIGSIIIIFGIFLNLVTTLLIIQINPNWLPCPWSKQSHWPVGTRPFHFPARSENQTSTLLRRRIINHIMYWIYPRKKYINIKNHGIALCRWSILYWLYNYPRNINFKFMESIVQISDLLSCSINFPSLLGWITTLNRVMDQHEY